MVVVKNRMNQPLTVNLNSSRSVYFLPKSIESLTTDEFESEELKGLIAAGFVVVLRTEPDELKKKEENSELELNENLEGGNY